MINEEKIGFTFIVRYLVSGLLFLCFLTSQAQPDFRRACIQANNSDVVITWLRAADPCNKFVSIQIYARLNTLSPYTLVDSISQINIQSYTHTGAATLGSTWQYYLVYKYLCDDTEFYSDTLFIDLTQPMDTPIDSVSYDPLTGKYTIGWSANSAPDLMGYTVWETNGPSNTVISNTVNTTYTDNTSSPSSSSKGYRISAYDSCINQSVISASHTPVFLSYTSNYCNNKITLKWSPYTGQPVSDYSVYLRLNTDPFIIDTILNSTSSQFFYELKSGDMIEVFIRANFTNGSSSRSNSISVSVLDSFPTDSNYIRSISWHDKNNLWITGAANTGFFFDSLYLYRYKNDSRSPLFGELSVKDYVYEDNQITDTEIYQYQQKLIDVCGRSYWSNFSNNIVLKSGAAGLTHSHGWNSYKSWKSGVAYYELQLSSSPQFNSTWNFLNTGLIDTFTQNVLDEADTMNSRCYRIAAYEQSPSPVGAPSVSLSNPYCIVEPPQVYFPNAIHINGNNPLFEPKGISINRERSTIQVYARNGQLVFSGDFNTFWDGKIGDNPLPTGVYIYFSQVYFLDGSKQIFKGNITLLH